MNNQELHHARAEEVPLEHLIPSQEALSQLPKSVAKRLQVVPLAYLSDERPPRMIVGCADPTQSLLLQKLQQQLPTDVDTQLVKVAEEKIMGALETCYHASSLIGNLSFLCNQVAMGSGLRPKDEGFVVRLFEALIRFAHRKRASDIHLTPDARSIHIALRIDGVMQRLYTVDKWLLPGLLVRIKVLASLDVAETRLPQDGRFACWVDGQHLDCRISTFPTVNGENTVVRLLREMSRVKLCQLAHDKNQLNTLQNAASLPSGLIIVCGPTGSGKSTTLHALIDEMDIKSRNIVALEDPVEIQHEGIRQTSIDASLQLSYAECLRFVLRQDPDVLLVGELRDRESCQLAMEAAMTGHLVLTTVHARNPAFVFPRLRNLGASSEELSELMSLIVCQRLVRKICSLCRGESAECQNCLGSGFYGRTAIVETVRVDASIQQMIVSNSSTSELEQYLTDVGNQSLRQQSDALLAKGLTSETEIQRVLGDR